MMRNIPAFRKRWLAVSATIVLLAVALTAGNLFAANERQQSDRQPLSEQSQMDGIDPGLVTESPAAKAELPENDTNSGVNQVTSESDSSDALAQWLSNRPDVMGPFTVEDAMSVDSGTVDWILYQAVYKDVMTEEEAETFRTWYDQRPSSQEAPQLLNHQPAYLDRPGGADATFRGMEAR